MPDLDPKEAGELDRGMVLRADALDLRKPWADEGRPGGLVEDKEAVLSAGGAEMDQLLPASAASSCSDGQYAVHTEKNRLHTFSRY